MISSSKKWVFKGIIFRNGGMDSLTHFFNTAIIIYVVNFIHSFNHAIFFVIIYSLDVFIHIMEGVIVIFICIMCI